jgi:transporter family protein
MNKGFLFALGTALVWGVGPIFAKLGVSKLPAMQAFQLRSIGAFLSFFVYSLFYGKIFSYPNLVLNNYKASLFLFIEGFLGAFLGQILYYNAQRNWEASKTIIVVSAFPIIAVFLAYTFLAEPLTPKKLIGVSFVILGIILVK